MGYSGKHKLSDDLRLRCPKLFLEYHAQLIEECQYPQPCGNAWVTLLIDDTPFRWIVDRGDLLVELNGPGGRYDWTYLDEACIRTAASDDDVPPLEQWCAMFIAQRERFKQAKTA